MSPDGEPRFQEVPYQRRVLLYGLLAPLPSVLICLALLISADLNAYLAWSLGAALVAVWVGSVIAFREGLLRPIRTLSSLLAALREGDLGIRARGARADDALGLAFLEINTLGESLREQRLGAQEATALLATVIEEIDVAIFAFDGAGHFRLVNRAGEKMLGVEASALLGRRAEEFEFDLLLRGPVPRTISRNFPGEVGRWELRRTSFRQEGKPNQLVVLADLSRALREEELKAWQRLIRVLRHELNNSLAPIQSIAGSLSDLIGREELTLEDREDLRQGLAVIQGRSAALGRFMSAYARLTHLPVPSRTSMDVGDWIHRVSKLENRLPIKIVGGPPVTIQADPDQLDQLLINLIRNAVEASLETEGSVEVHWKDEGGELRVRVCDEGAGIAETANLFVPFFTTKPNGSGIGLALSRQIAEAHGGSLRLENREDRRGARATLVLPHNP